AEPVPAREVGPANQVLDCLETAARLGGDRPHRQPGPVSRREIELCRQDREDSEVLAGAGKCFGIRQRETEAMDQVAPGIVVLTQRAISTDHAAQVAASVGYRLLRRVREPAEAHELVVRGEERALVRALLGAGDVLPAAFGEEAVVAAGD